MKVGDKLKDNDPRMSWRQPLVIVSFGITTAAGAEHVYAQNINGQKFRIQTKRIYSDGKQRRSGFTLVEQDGQAARP